ncbi:S-layer homology domain-containing protein [Paenibacillus sp. P25]|nr:S-layer homology domain-containing protein [Paenibacillus sp. P25]
MKKSLTLLTAAAVALSTFTSAAFADTSKSTSDFKDLAGIDAGLKSKMDSLLSKGIFEGVSSDSFGISQNMTRAQFAKVAALVFGLQVDPTLRTSGFTDVRADDAANGWAIPYIEAARKAGLIDGMTDTSFAPGEQVTIGQLDTVLVKGLGKAVNTAASPWYADAVKQASELGVHPAGKSGDMAATRADLVEGAYGALAASGKPRGQAQPVSIVSVQASGDHAVQVTLDQAVDTSKAVLSLSKDGAVLPTTVAWSDNRQSAALTLSGDAKLSVGSYTVTLSGLDPASVKTATGTLTVTPSANDGDLQYSIGDTYDLSGVIENGITALATGRDGQVTRAEAEDPAFSKFAKEIVFSATSASGSTVALPGIVQSVTSSNPGVVKTAVTPDHKGYILGNKAGKATVSVVFSTTGGGSARSPSLLQSRKTAFRPRRSKPGNPRSIRT